MEEASQKSCNGGHLDPDAAISGACFRAWHSLLPEHLTTGVLIRAHEK